jgi:hypothetical protein
VLSALLENKTRKNLIMKYFIATFSLVTLLLSQQAHADLFYAIASVTSDTAANDFFPAANLVEGAGVGFDAAAPHDRTSTLTWVTAAPNGGNGDYFGPTPTPGPRLVFDLGKTVPLQEISVWGYADTNGNGANQFSLRFASAADGPTGFGTSISFNPTYNPIQAQTPRQRFDFGQFVNARYVELTPEDNFFGIAPPGGDRVGLGEVAFMIPEPSAGGLMLLGFALLGGFRKLNPRK